MHRTMYDKGAVSTKFHEFLPRSRKIRYVVQINGAWNEVIYNESIPPGSRSSGLKQ